MLNHTNSQVSISQTVILILVLLVILCGCGKNKSVRRQPIAKAGVLDLRDWDFERDGAVNLKGEWEFHWKQFLKSEDFNSPEKPVSTRLIYVPRSWHLQDLDEERLPLFGYATYRMRVLLNKQQNHLALKTRLLLTSHIIYVNGQKISQIGKPGKSREETRAQYKFYVTRDFPDNSELDIVIQISNYEYYKGGLSRDIDLGTGIKLRKIRRNNLIINAFCVGVIFLVGIYHLFLYFFTSKGIEYLYFSLFAFFGTLNYFLFPEGYIFELLPWMGTDLSMYFTRFHNILAVVLVYLFLFLFMRSSFTTEFSKTVFNLIVFILITCGFIILLIDVRVYLYAQIILSFFGILIFAYLIFILIKAVRNKRTSSNLFLLSFGIVLFGLIHDGVLHALGLSNLSIIHYTNLIFFLLQSLALSRQFSQNFRNAIVLSEELSANNRKLIALDKQKDDILANLDQTVKERTHELSEKNRILESIETSLKKYLPKQLVDTITKGDQAAEPKTERRKLTVFFSDIKGFTDLTESMEAEDMSKLLNEYLTEMTNIANKWGGTVDKFIGDAIMIFYGAPEETPDKDNALNCVKMAIEMQEKMKELQKKWFHEGIENPLEIRIGISTGTATVGNFGAEDRLSYTVIGGQVNIASRLEGICEPNKIKISHPTWALISEVIECTPGEKVKVKGINREIMTYDVLMGS